MTSVWVMGIGMIPFGKYPDRTLVDLGAEAAHLAIKDAGLIPDQVESGIFANVLAGQLFKDITIGQNVFWEVGVHCVPVFNVENACTSGSTAFWVAHNMIAAGQVEVVMVVGAEKMCVPQFGLVNSGATELDTLLGLVTPGSFALRAVRHMEEYGTTAAQLAQVAVKNRAHARLNPFSQFRHPISLNEVLDSPVIVDPLTRLQCCPIADGAAAVVLCSTRMAKKSKRSVRVNAAVLATGGYESPQDLTHWETDYRACASAYKLAGIGPEDLDVVEVHDAFTIAEVLHYEALGLCPAGEGGRYAEEGNSSLGGKTPVNVSGGLLSRGHPLAATGVAQVFEIITQLRGDARERQVENARVGLAQCMGGDKAGDAKSCTVLVFSV